MSLHPRPSRSAEGEARPWLLCVNLQQTPCGAACQEEIGGFAQLLAAARRARWPIAHCLHKPQAGRPAPPLAPLKPLISEPVFFHGAGTDREALRLADALAARPSAELIVMGRGLLTGARQILTAAMAHAQVVTWAPWAGERDDGGWNLSTATRLRVRSCRDILEEHRLDRLLDLANDP